MAALKALFFYPSELDLLISEEIDQSSSLAVERTRTD